MSRPDLKQILIDSDVVGVLREDGDVDIVLDLRNVLGGQRRVPLAAWGPVVARYLEDFDGDPSRAVLVPESYAVRKRS